MDRRLQALEDRATYVCIIQSDSAKKRRARNTRRVERGRETTERGTRSGQVEARRGTTASEAMSYLIQIDTAALDAALFRARLRHGESKDDSVWVMGFPDARERTGREQPGHEYDLLNP